MGLGRDGGAVDEDLALGGLQQVVLLVAEDFQHRLVVGDDGDDDIGKLGDAGEFGTGLGAEFLGEFGG